VTKDATAPTISRVSTAVTASGVTIGWTTNEPSDTQVEYGPTTSYGALTPLNAALQTAHAQTISSLKPNTEYHFRVRSRDAAGNLRVSKDFRLKMRSR
jgi:purple acid phosphatase-like protein